MTTKKITSLLDVKEASAKIEKRIKIIRSKHVLMDRDLATLYGVETKVLNQSVKRNPDRFPERNCFQLNKSEFELLRSQFVTLKAENGRGKHVKYLPYAFTEQGVAMLSTVLHSHTAIQVSLQIMDAFVQMRHCLIDNQDITGTNVVNLAMQVSQNTIDIASLRSDYQKILDNFVDPSTFKHFLILNGQKLEADVAYTQIYSMAKKSILIVDNYTGVKTLDLLRGVAKNAKVTIMGDSRVSHTLTNSMIADFNSARPDVEISMRDAGNKFHDRYIVLDFGMKNEKMFHCGASSKDAGNKITTIMKIEDINVYRDVLKEMLN